MQTIDSATDTDPTRFEMEIVGTDLGGAEWTEYRFPVDGDRRMYITVVEEGGPGTTWGVEPYFDRMQLTSSETARRAARALIAACDLADELNRASGIRVGGQ